MARKLIPSALNYLQAFAKLVVARIAEVQHLPLPSLPNLEALCIHTHRLHMHVYKTFWWGATYLYSKVHLQGHATGKYPPVMSTTLSNHHGTEACPFSFSPTPASGNPAACCRTPLSIWAQLLNLVPQQHALHSTRPLAF